MKVAILAGFPLFVIPDCEERFRTPGHYATWLPMLVREFSQMSDLEIHWIVISRLVAAPEEIRWLDQTFHILPAAPKGCRATTLYASERQAIRACLDAIDPDLVHGWGTEDVYGLAAVQSGRPNIISMQGILSYYMLRNRMHPREYLHALIELYVLRKAMCITVESAWGRDIILRRKRKAHVELVEYGANELFRSVPWLPDPQKPAAIFVGGIHPRKGIQDAVAAFGDPRLNGAELWVIGSGKPAFAEELQRQATPNVKWLGRLSQQEIAEKLSRAWCLVLPTRADTSPNVVKEARVIGLPVITTRYGGQTTYVQHGETGFIVEPGDVTSLARYLAQLLGDYEKAKAFGACRHQEHRAALNPRETARRFHDLYLASNLRTGKSDASARKP